MFLMDKKWKKDEIINDTLYFFYSLSKFAL